MCMITEYDEGSGAATFQNGKQMLVSLPTMDYRSIITLEPGKRGGKPCIRGLRITVEDVLGWLASGMSAEAIFTDYPELTKEDVLACLAYAADREKHATWVHVAR
jgi:uncharacterized protein (DUF433 family)